MVAIGTVVGGKVLVIDAQGIAPLMEEAGDGVGTDYDAEVPSALAILSVVRRDHFRPVMGSPAVSDSSRNSIRGFPRPFFFEVTMAD